MLQQVGLGEQGLKEKVVGLRLGSASLKHTKVQCLAI